MGKEEKEKTNYNVWKDLVLIVEYQREEKTGRGNLDTIAKLCHLIYAHGDERLKTRAALCHIYSSALHDKFYDARDMMLMSHLQVSRTLSLPF